MQNLSEGKSQEFAKLAPIQQQLGILSPQNGEEGQPQSMHGSIGGSQQESIENHELSNQFYEACAESIRKYEECWKQLNSRVEESLASNLEHLERQIREHNTFEDTFKNLDMDMLNAEELYRQLLDHPTQTQLHTYNKMVDLRKFILRLSPRYMERLKALEVVLKGLDEVSEIVMEHEISLASFDDFPAELKQLQEVHAQLQELNKMVDQEDNIARKLNEDTKTLRQHIARTRPGCSNWGPSTPQPDMDQLEAIVSQLTDRWDTVNGQVADRLRFVEEAKQSQMVYRSRYNEELRCLDQVESTFDDKMCRQPEELGPEELLEQLDELFEEYTQLQYHRPIIERIKKDGDKFVRDAKSYGILLGQYHDSMTKIHRPKIHRQQVSQSSKTVDMIVTGELELLNRRFIEVSSVILERKDIVMKVLLQNWQKWNKQGAVVPETFSKNGAATSQQQHQQIVEPASAGAGDQQKFYQQPSRQLPPTDPNSPQPIRVQMRCDMLYYTMFTLKCWKLDKFLRIPADQREEVTKVLSEEVDKLLSELDPDDPLARRIKKELRKTNEHLHDLLAGAQKAPAGPSEDSDEMGSISAWLQNPFLDEQEISLTTINGGKCPAAVSLPQPPGLQQGEISDQPPKNSLELSPPSRNSAVNNPFSPFSIANPQNKGGQGVQLQMMPVGQQQVGGELGAIAAIGEQIPPPEPPSLARDWHTSVTPNLRNHLIEKLVKAVFPYPDHAVHDQCIRDQFTYARKAEKDMFEAAPNREAYYHMLADKIYKVQKELKEREQQLRAVPGTVEQPPMMDMDSGGRAVDCSTVPMSQQNSLVEQSQNNNKLEEELQEEDVQVQKVMEVGEQPQETEGEQQSSTALVEGPAESFSPQHLTLQFIFRGFSRI